MSLFVLGIFELGSGRETQTLRPNSTQYTRHHVYDTTLQCEDPNAQLHVELREFITGNITPRANGTLCFLISKAFVPPTSSSNNPVQPVLFESQALIPFPGDVNQPDYDDNIPLDTHAYVFASGTVCGAHFTNINGSVVFPMQVQEFIRGESKMCVIECKLAKDTPRWRNTNVPAMGAYIQIYGKCTTFGMVHRLLVTIENLVTTPAAAGIGAPPGLPPNDPGPSSSTPPRKRRKYGPATSPESTAYSPGVAPAGSSSPMAVGSNAMSNPFAPTWPANVPVPAAAPAAATTSNTLVNPSSPFTPNVMSSSPPTVVAGPSNIPMSNPPAVFAGASDIPALNHLAPVPDPPTQPAAGNPTAASAESNGSSATLSDAEHDSVASRTRRGLKGKDRADS